MWLDPVGTLFRSKNRSRVARPLDIGKAVENDFKSERLDADMPASAIDLNGPPAICQQKKLLVLADSEHSLAATRRVDPDNVCQPLIDGFADARREHPAENVSLPEHGRGQRTFVWI